MYPCLTAGEHSTLPTIVVVGPASLSGERLRPSTSQLPGLTALRYKLQFTITLELELELEGCPGPPYQ